MGNRDYFQESLARIRSVNVLRAQAPPGTSVDPREVEVQSPFADTSVSGDSALRVNVTCIVYQEIKCSPISELGVGREGRQSSTFLVF